MGPISRHCSQWKLGRRFTSRLGIWLQASVRRAVIRIVRGHSSGKLRPHVFPSYSVVILTCLEGFGM